jgi:2-polyprenyl-3-methyl-5-hydroxy-6-metoxy-1,4-benzoquinol methylase
MTRFVEIAVDLLGVKSLFSKDVEKESLNEFYNTIEGDIDEKAYNSDLFVQKYWQQRKTDEIKTCLKINTKDIIIDIGCGSGVQIRETGASKAKLAIGVDLNKNALLFAREKKIPNTDYIIADAEKLPFKSENIDKIICAEIIEHLINPKDMILEIKRVLKKNGEIIITTPNEFSFWGIYELFWDLFGRGRNYGQTHLMFYSPGELKAYFKDFSEANTKTIFFVSPFFALFNNDKILSVFKKFDSLFERLNLGLSLIFSGKK